MTKVIQTHMKYFPLVQHVSSASKQTLCPLHRNAEHRLAQMSVITAKKLLWIAVLCGAVKSMIMNINH